MEAEAFRDFYLSALIAIQELKKEAEKKDARIAELVGELAALAQQTPPERSSDPEEAATRDV